MMRDAVLAKQLVLLPCHLNPASPILSHGWTFTLGEYLP
jgi:hypothetical protein